MKRAEIFALALVLIPWAQQVRADSFDRSPAGYGSLLNAELQQTGSELRFDGCSMSDRRECRFSSPRVAMIVQGRERPPRISQIAITTNLLRDNPVDSPDAAIGDALTTLTVTMILLDPELEPNQREQVVSSLTDAALQTGYGESRGVNAHYSVTFDQAANGLLVMMVESRRKG